MVRGGYRFGFNELALLFGLMTSGYCAAGCGSSGGGYNISQTPVKSYEDSVRETVDSITRNQRFTIPYPMTREFSTLSVDNNNVCGNLANLQTAYPTDAVQFYCALWTDGLFDPINTCVANQNKPCNDETHDKENQNDSEYSWRIDRANNKVQAVLDTWDSTNSRKTKNSFIFSLTQSQMDAFVTYINKYLKEFYLEKSGDRYIHQDLFNQDIDNYQLQSGAARESTLKKEIDSILQKEFQSKMEIRFRDYTKRRM